MTEPASSLEKATDRARPTSAKPGLQPITLASAHGALVGFYHPPVGTPSAAGDVLLVPAFAEEMNRCRSMVTLQAQALAAAGIGTLVLDMHGTGDSPGEFDQADWDGWKRDLELGVQWLRSHGNGCRTLWGVRLGALMATQMAAADASLDRLLLWTPVVNGKNYWTQFLRIRIASEMSLPDGVKTTEALRQQSAAGLTVEASGYLIGPTLAAQLDQLNMPPGEALAGKSIAWFEITVSAEAVVPRANAKQVEAWQAQGAQASLTQVVGPQFWLVHEREVAPALIDASTAAIQAWGVPGSKSAAPTRLAVALPDSMDPDVAAECPVVFPCLDDELAGIVHRGNADARTAVVIVVAGGPQYRVGAHRQFVSLARLFASAGYPVLRFDLRGMGDSSGDYRGYEHSRPDIRAAIDELMRREPTIREVALFGECESASGILFYAAQDARVRRIALANPWVRTPGVQAEAILKHYYLDRLRSREFWLSVRSGKYKVGASLASFYQVFVTFLRSRKSLRAGTRDSAEDKFDHLPLPSRTAEGLRRFRGKVLLLLSGRDLIAREFDEVTKVSQDWQGLLSDPRVTRTLIADADHTFSKPEVKVQAQRALLDWVGGSGTPS